MSALFSTALESMTLPSRLRVQNGKRESLDEIAGALNVNGNQNMAKLQMSIVSKPLSNGDHRSGRLDVRAQSRDSRMPSQNGRAEPVIIDDAVNNLDMDFFPSKETFPPRGRHPIKKVHVFGQAEAFRGDEDKDEKDNDDFDGQERARRRAAGLPILHK